MEYRELGRTGWKVSSVSFGAWAIGGSWGTVDDRESIAALNRAIDLGVNFIDTADVYGDGRSERLVAKVRKERKENIYVATKAGRRLDPHVAGGYNRANLTAFVERSLKNLDTDAIDILYRSNSIGIRCPDHPVASLLLRSANCPVVAPSANLSGTEPAVLTSVTAKPSGSSCVPGILRPQGA